MRLPWGRGAIIVGTIVAACAVALPAAADGSAPLLPDLDPIAPSAVGAQAATDGSGRVYLTFTFTLDNKGAGPMVLRGHRASTAEPTMTADQVIRNVDGTETVVPAVGQLEWLPTTGYRRWGFRHQRYELLDTNGAQVGTAATVGLCMQDDRNSPGPALPGEPPSKVFLGGCGKNKPNLLSLDLGLSVGWRNLHSAGRLGQLIDVTALPSGEYMLVVRVNADGALSESDTANNAASARVSITWIDGQALPAIAVLATCPNSATC
ncbi:MAG: lysyl oxidase family protein [Gaiellales bacterium]